MERLKYEVEDETIAELLGSRILQMKCRQCWSLLKMLMMRRLNI